MASINSLVSRRAGNRGAVTRLLPKIQAIIDDRLMEKERKIHELNRKLMDLHNKIKTIEALDDEIQGAIGEDELEAEIDNSCSANSIIKDALDAGEYALEELRKVAIDDQIALNAVTVPLAPHAPIATTIAVPDSSNLPKFNLPEFDVEVHNKTKYSDATKFNFLNSRLTGEAKALLMGLTPNNANHPKAVDLLKERFGQPHKIIMAHMRAFLSLPKPGLDKTSLRRFVDNLEANIRGLEALGKGMDSYGDLLVCILLDKLTADLRRNLARQHGAIEWTLEELRNAMKKEIEILEDSTDHSIIKHSESNKQAGVMFTKTSRVETERKRIKHCAYCTGNHFPTDCNNVVTTEERYTIARGKHLCFNCLRSQQSTNNECPSKFRCRICQKAHHTSLHSNSRHGNYTNSSTRPRVETNTTILSSNPTTVALTANGSRNSFASQSFVLLETAVVPIQAKGVTLKGNVLIDKGAQRSFITTELAKKLQLKTLFRENLVLVGFAAASSNAEIYDVVQVSFRDINGCPIDIQAIVINHIVDPLDDPHRALIGNLPHLRNLQLAHPASMESQFRIDILIGADYYWDIVSDKIVRGQGPTAVSSKLGYLLSGCVSNLHVNNSDQTAMLNVSVEEKFDISRLWDLEMLGIQPETEAMDITSEYQNNCIEFKQNKYQARLPWKTDHPTLSSNQFVCERRTRSMIKRLGKTPSNLQLYDSTIQQQLANEFIEKVPHHEINIKSGCHYVPHHGVIKESTTTPLRIVYDCSCKTYKGVSLNDCLNVGPSLQNNMLEILLRFRTHNIGLVADIEKAYHQILLHEADRDFLRFFWIKDGKDPNSEFETYRFRVIPFGASSSPFILLSVIKKHLAESSSKIAIDMDQNIYVDNLISGCETEKEAHQYYNQANAIMKQAGLKLQEWATNNRAVQTTINLDDERDKNSFIKILGLRWSRSNDTLMLPKFYLTTPNATTVTKRIVLRKISTVYDPMGFISPLTISARILIQEIWKLKLQWDDPLSPEMQERWNGITQAIEKSNTEVPRTYLTTGLITEIHIFVDASQQAYGAIAYVCNKTQQSFAFSKSRVAPLKKDQRLLTLPQMELMAATIGTRIATSILNAFKPLGLTPKCVLWSDSQIVLYWLHQSKSNKNLFVSNRVRAIREFNQTSTAEWRYCPTHQNPADLLTRGITLKQFSHSFWYTGPPWLTKPEEWPSWKIENLSESIRHIASTVVIDNKAHSDQKTRNDISNILHAKQYRWRSLLRITAIICRFANNIRFHDASRKSWIKGHITAFELKCAETLWIRSIQDHHFPVEKEYLQEQKGKRPALVSQLDLIMDKNKIIRCQGRLGNAKLNLDTISPILLPKKCRITKLIIEAYHINMLHGGTNHTVSAIRQRYWIPSIKQSVKTVIRDCVTCRRVNGAAYTPPNHAPLPACRVSNDFPFTTTGVDFTGAFTIRGQKDIKKQDKEVYVLLFTCASSRAIHLEVVDDLATKTFLEAFRCFTSHHAIPSVIISDNAKTFEAAAKTFQKLFQSAEIQRHFSDRQIHWRFIPKCAPWYGGFWERLIAITKTTLKKMLGRTKPTLNEFRALIAEAEAVLNDRPLQDYPTTIEAKDILTPSHLMYGRRITTLPFNENLAEEELDPSFDEKPSELKRSIIRHQKLLGHFKKQFLSSYIPALREFHSHTRKTQPTIVKEKDIVLIHDDGPRKHWKMAVVEELIKSADGQVRAVDLRTAHGKTNRPITRLHPLRLSEPNHEPANVAVSTPSSRPLRRAAELARDRIKKMSEE
ncbi:uncharacterized protein LOC130698388 [Daphnia carinata]|uniref:uncharacterized protein LOC130698388 n=1 Tax=Daphnia carinata TaxID=120202 RepID=UPI002580B2C1|nr:uncharacterized protein LOC130698388 [Daphnia carinata]